MSQWLTLIANSYISEVRLLRLFTYQGTKWACKEDVNRYGKNDGKLEAIGVSNLPFQKRLLDKEKSSIVSIIRKRSIKSIKAVEKDDAPVLWY